MSNDDNEEEELKNDPDIERWCDDKDVSRETRLKVSKWTYK